MEWECVKQGDERPEGAVQGSVDELEMGSFVFDDEGIEDREKTDGKAVGQP